MNKNFKKYIYNQEVTPPESVWQNIEKALDAKSDKKGFGYFQWMLVSIIALLITMGSWWAWHEKDSYKSSSTDDNIKETIENNRTHSGNSDSHENFTIKNHSQIEETLKDNSRHDAEAQMNIEPNGITSYKSSSHQKEKELATHFSKSENTQKSNAFTSKTLKIDSTRKTKLNKIEKNQGEKSIAQIEDKTTQKVQLLQNYAMASNTPDSLVLTQIENDAIPQLEKTNPEKEANITSENMQNENAIAGDETTEDSEINMNQQLRDQKRWGISGIVSPSYTRSASNEDIWLLDLNQYNGQYVEAIDFGLQLEYKITPKWTVRTGAGINNLKQRATEVVIAPQNSNSGKSDIKYSENLSIVNSENFSESNIDYSGIKRGSVEQHIQYFSVPIEFGYTFYQSKRIDLSLYAGSSTKYLTQNYLRLSTENFSTKFGEATNLNRLIFGAQAGFQTKFKLGNRIGLIIEPKISYLFNTFKDNKNVRPYSVNFNAGLLFGF